MTIYDALVKVHPVKIPNNGTLHFEQIANTFTFNPVTGNNEPDRTLIDVPCFFRRITQRSHTDQRSNLSKELALRGYLLPAGNELSTLDIHHACELTVTTPETGTVRGIFEFQVRVNPLMGAIKQVVGVPVDGVLSLAGSGEV